MLSKRIKLARLATGMSLDDCVAKLNAVGVPITKPALSYYENGKRTPNASMLKELGKLFSVPASWFIKAEPSFSINWYAFRAQVSLGDRKKETIEAYATKKAEMAAYLFELMPGTCVANFPERKKIAAVKDADLVAAELRKRWNLGSDALESVTQILESKGAVVIDYDKQPTAAFDGLSALINNKFPLLIINNSVPPDRLRFDLSHELGHVLMDTSSFSDEKMEETAAHRFASSFLLPPDMLKFELGTRRSHLTLSELVLLKEKYGISVSALLYAARVHGVINEQMYKKLQIQLSAAGWRKREPDVFTGNEKPAKIRQLVTRAVAEGLLEMDKACTMFPEYKSLLQEEFTIEESYVTQLRKKPRKERDEWLRMVAESAAKEYENNPDLLVGDITDLDE